MLVIVVSLQLVGSLSLILVVVGVVRTSVLRMQPGKEVDSETVHRHKLNSYEGEDHQ